MVLLTTLDIAKRWNHSDIPLSPSAQTPRPFKTISTHRGVVTSPFCEEPPLKIRVAWESFGTFISTAPKLAALSVHLWSLLQSTLPFGCCELALSTLGGFYRGLNMRITRGLWSYLLLRLSPSTQKVPCNSCGIEPRHQPFLKAPWDAARAESLAYSILFR